VPRAKYERRKGISERGRRSARPPCRACSDYSTSPARPNAYDGEREWHAMSERRKSLSQPDCRSAAWRVLWIRTTPRHALLRHLRWRDDERLRSPDEVRLVVVTRASCPPSSLTSVSPSPNGATGSGRPSARPSAGVGGFMAMARRWPRRALAPEELRGSVLCDGDAEDSRARGSRALARRCDVRHWFDANIMFA